MKTHTLAKAQLPRMMPPVFCRLDGCEPDAPRSRDFHGPQSVPQVPWKQAMKASASVVSVMAA